MAEYKISSPGAELLGGMVYAIWSAFPEGFQQFIKKILAEHGMEEIVADQWYRLQPVLDSLKEVEEKYGHHLLWQVGEQAASRAPVPPEIDSLKTCLLSLNGTLQKFHRGGDIGGYEIKEETEAGLIRFVVVASTPYPCSLTRGYLEGFAKRFRKDDTKEVLVRHDDTSPCRRNGADTCTYILTLW